MTHVHRRDETGVQANLFTRVYAYTFTRALIHICTHTCGHVLRVCSTQTCTDLAFRKFEDVGLGRHEWELARVAEFAKHRDKDVV